MQIMQTMLSTLYAVDSLRLFNPAAPFPPTPIHIRASCTDSTHQAVAVGVSSLPVVPPAKVAVDVL